MKIVRDGITYDTASATLIAEVGQEDWGSDGWAGLYRTSEGAFFEIVVDHDGSTILKLGMVDRNQARAFVERHANDQVEKHFGVMPTPQAPRFSRRTVIAAAEVLEGAYRTHADLTRCLLKWSPELATVCDGGALADRFNHLIKFVDQTLAYRVDGGALLMDALVEKAVSLFPSNPAEMAWLPTPTLSPTQSALRHALDLDGFTVTDGELRRTLPAELNLPEAEDEIARLLNKHGFETARGHLKQAFAAHTNGDWAAANSQIRTFLDGLLDEITERIDPESVPLASGQPRRAKLASKGFLSRPLNEWDDNGLGFINGLIKRLHPHGSHPGLSDPDDSTFRLHIVLITARLILTRYDVRETP